jgi:IclR family transcriptional regulator, acetate operon repressor
LKSRQPGPIDILQAFAGHPHGLKIVELERLTGLARPTLYRLVRTLEGRQLLRQSSDPARYELDVGVVGLAQTWLRSVDLVSKAEAALQMLASDVGETVILAIARGDVRVYVREIPSHHALTYSRGVGVTESILKGAGGLSILAFEPQAKIDRLLRTIPPEERKAIEAELKATRTRGFSSSRNAIINGATAVAAPILNAAGLAAGSVGIFGPSTRITKSDVTRIGPRLLACARDISAFAT